MKLFRIKTRDYSNHQQDNITHKIFIDDKEELEFRRIMDENMQRQIIKNYQMCELSVKDVEDMFTLTGLSLQDLKKLILHNEKEELKLKNQDIDRQENDYSQVDIIEKLKNVKKDDSNIYRYFGGTNFKTLNELIVNKHIDKIYVNRGTIVDITACSVTTKIDIDTVLSYCQISESTANKDMLDLWYSVNCGFNFNNNNYYAYSYKIPFVIDDRLSNHMVVGLHMGEIVLLGNVN